jgi:hypothetical protein
MASGGASLISLPADQITVRDQDFRSGLILVEAITTTRPGWVVFYKNPNFTPGEIVGYAPVYPGVNTNVSLDLSSASTEVWAQLHTDDGRRGVFEWERQEEPVADWPVVQDRRYVRASFSATTAPVPTIPIDLKAAQIKVHDQRLDTGIITVDSVTTPHKLIVHRASNHSRWIVGCAGLQRHEHGRKLPSTRRKSESRSGRCYWIAARALRVVTTASSPAIRPCSRRGGNNFLAHWANNPIQPRASNPPEAQRAAKTEAASAWPPFCI